MDTLNNICTFAINKDKMVKENTEILNNFLEANCPSGNEKLIVDLFKSAISPFVDDVSIDMLGNCIAHKKGNGKKFMLMSHCDEVGLMINHIDEQGYLYFKEVGGIDTNVLLSQRVLVEGNDGKGVVGIIGRKPIHLQSKAEGSLSTNTEDLWIDIAAPNKDEAQKKVSIGAYASYLSKPLLFENGIIVSKSLDDRIGLYTMIQIAQEIQNTDKEVYFIASVQEEIGARGAMPITMNVMPDVGIAIDVTHATDYPSISVIKYGDIKLGKGVVVPLGPNMNRDLTRAIISCSEKLGIPIQKEVITHPTGTDAKMIQISGNNISTGLISIPCRYMHTCNEMVSLDDVRSATSLLVEYIRNSDN